MNVRLGGRCAGKVTALAKEVSVLATMDGEPWNNLREDLIHPCSECEHLHRRAVKPSTVSRLHSLTRFRTCTLPVTCGLEHWLRWLLPRACGRRRSRLCLPARPRGTLAG